MNSLCVDHKYIYGGVRYRVTNENYPGSGGKLRIYAEWFYCNRCLKERLIYLDHDDLSYNPPQFNATPMRRTDG